MTTPTPKRADGEFPAPHVRAARDTLAPGSAGRAAPVRTPAAGAAHRSSPQPSERQAAGKPAPGTGAEAPLLASAPVRGPAISPAGASLKAHGSHPAGSTGTLFVDLQDAERATRELARREDSKAFLNDHLARKMTEAELEEQIRDACKKLGIVRFHVRFSVGTTPGLPDDILIGPRGVLWRECKTAKGKVTAAQQEAGGALTAAGQDWAVWRPVDWFSGRVVRELTAISRTGAVA